MSKSDFKHLLQTMNKYSNFGPPRSQGWEVSNVWSPIPKPQTPVMWFWEQDWNTCHNPTCTHRDIHLLKFLEFESPLQSQYLCTVYALLVLRWVGLTLTAITHLHPWNE